MFLFVQISDPSGYGGGLLADTVVLPHETLQTLVGAVEKLRQAVIDLDASEIRQMLNFNTFSRSVEYECFDETSSTGRQTFTIDEALGELLRVAFENDCWVLTSGIPQVGLPPDEDHVGGTELVVIRSGFWLSVTGDHSPVEMESSFFSWAEWKEKLKPAIEKHVPQT